MKKFNLYCGFKSTMYDSIRHRIWSVMRQFFFNSWLNLCKDDSDRNILNVLCNLRLQKIIFDILESFNTSIKVYRSVLWV